MKRKIPCANGKADATPRKSSNGDAGQHIVKSSVISAAPYGKDGSQKEGWEYSNHPGYIPKSVSPKHWLTQQEPFSGFLSFRLPSYLREPCLYIGIDVNALRLQLGNRDPEYSLKLFGPVSGWGCLKGLIDHGGIVALKGELSANPSMPSWRVVE